MEYPKITDNNFTHKINKIYDKYKIPKERKTMKEICFPEKFKLQPPQIFLPNFINPNTPYNGILIFHKIGSGKTCTAIRIGEKWKKSRKIVVIVPASLIGNFRNELRSQCVGEEYLTNKERNKLKKMYPRDIEYKEIIKKSNERIDKYYNIMSYHKFLRDYKKINLRKSILIVDEIQNMISEGGKFYLSLKKSIDRAPKDLKIILMSATPMFDKAKSIALLMNLFDLKEKLPIGINFVKKYIVMKIRNNKVSFETKNLDDFKRKIKGYISYYPGAPSYVFPELSIRYIKCNMDDFQYRIYKKVFDNENIGYKFGNIKDIYRHINVIELPNNFFIGTRIVSNIVFPNKEVGKYGLSSLTKRIILNDLEKYSTKFHRLMKKIIHCDGKIFIYSNFKKYGGLETLIKILEAFGYKNYSKFDMGIKRYAVWSGDTSLYERDIIQNVYNSDKNLTGKKIKIILGSPSMKEGVSLIAVKQVHIMEPYWNEKRLDQIIGRAIRFCSHKNVSLVERYVKVYIYIATSHKEKPTVDEYIHFIAERKTKLINDFERALKEVSIDCYLNKNANRYTKDKKITCDK
jgi:superfamily II DNA or RNA helicase